MIYPYLGSKKLPEGGNVIVFFTSQNKGVVIMSDSEKKEYKFGLNSEFNEDEYDFLKEEICVRLNN